MGVSEIQLRQPCVGKPRAEATDPCETMSCCRFHMLASTWTAPMESCAEGAIVGSEVLIGIDK